MQNYVIFVEKESYKSSLEIKIIERLEIITIMQINIEAQQIVISIQNLSCLMKSL